MNFCFNLNSSDLISSIGRQNRKIRMIDTLNYIGSFFRYIPKVQTLRHIDQFCENSIVECDSGSNPRASLWSKSLNQEPGTLALALNAHSPYVHASNFASPELVKSLNYVRALVARHIPKLSFQPLTQSGGRLSFYEAVTSHSIVFVE